MIEILAVVLGLCIGTVTSVITGISLPVITFLLVKTGLADRFPLACLLFTISLAITRQLLEVITAHKGAVLSLEPEVNTFAVQASKGSTRREFVKSILEIGQSIREALYAKINGLRAGYLVLGIPLLLLSSILPINTLVAVLGVLNLISVPALCIGIAVSCFKSPRLGLFMCIAGTLVWLMLNSPAMAAAPSSAPILLVFSCAITIQQLLRQKQNTPAVPLHWLEAKYTPKLSWKLSLLGLRDWIFAIAGGAVAGLTPGFVKVMTSSTHTTESVDSNHRSAVTQMQVQAISEVLSLFIVILGLGNARTSLSAETYALLPQPSPVIAALAVVVIELVVRVTYYLAPHFVRFINHWQPSSLLHVFIPNVVCLLLAFGPQIAIPGILTSIAIGLLHRQLRLKPEQIVTVLSLPTLLVLTPFNAALIKAIFR